MALHPKLPALATPLEQIAQVASNATATAEAALTRKSGSITVQNSDGTTTVIGQNAGTDETGGPKGVQTFVGDTTPPGTPTGISFTTDGRGNVRGVWDGTLDGGVPADFSYIEFRSSGEPFGRVTEVGSATSALPFGTLSCDAVAVDVQGNTSDACEAITVSNADEFGEIDSKATEAAQSATAAETAAEEAKAAAAATSQHFWHDDNGCHVSTDEAQAEGTRNALWNSEGLLFREGANNNASITGGAVAFYDGEGNDAANVTAVFGSSTATIGKTTEQHVELDADGLELYDGEGQRLASLGKSTVTLGEQDEAASIKMCGEVFDVTTVAPEQSWNDRKTTMTGRGPISVFGTNGASIGSQATQEHQDFYVDDDGNTVYLNATASAHVGEISRTDGDFVAPQIEASASEVMVKETDGTVAYTNGSSLQAAHTQISSYIHKADNLEGTSDSSTLTQTTDSLVFDKTICATGGAASPKTTLTNINRESTGTAGMYMNWASPTATGAPSLNSKLFHVRGYEGYATQGYDMQVAQAGFGDAALAVRSQNAGTWGSWNYCLLSTQKLRVFAGTLVKTTGASDSVQVWNATTFQNTFGTSPLNAFVAFENGDGAAQSVHIEGATRTSAGVYAVFNKNAVAGAIRINYLVVCWA